MKGKYFDGNMCVCCEFTFRGDGGECGRLYVMKETEKAIARLEVKGDNFTFFIFIIVV